MVGPVETALELREERFDLIGVDSVMHVLTSTVVDRTVRRELWCQ